MSSTKIKKRISVANEEGLVEESGKVEETKGEKT